MQSPARQQEWDSSEIYSRALLSTFAMLPRDTQIVSRLEG